MSGLYNMRVMTTLRERYDQLVADHDRVLAGVKRANGGDLDKTLDPESAEIQQWYHQFTEVKDRVYGLAYDLDIPFEQGGEATADDYMLIWNQIQVYFLNDGNRRARR